VDRLKQADKFRSTNTKMQIDFSSLTVYNTGTGYNSADGWRKNQNKGHKKEIWSPCTIFNTWTQFSFADNSDFEFKIKNGGQKNYRLASINMELSFVDSGQHVDFKTIDKEK